MRIWIVNQYATPPSHSGGTRHYSLARALQARGIEAEIFCSTQNYLTGARVAKAGRAIRDGVAFTFLDSGNSPVVGRRSGRLAAMLGFALAFRRAVRRLPLSPTVTVGSSPSPIAAWAAAQEARRRGTAFVLEVRDLWPQTLVDVGRYARWHPGVLGFGVLERALYRRADHIISLLPNAERHISAVCPGASGVSWIPNGVDLRLAPSPRFDGGSSARPDGPFVVAYAGAHGPANALDAIVDAAALLAARRPGGFRFVFVGDGHDKPRLQRRVETMQLANVHFHDPVPKADVYRLLAAADGLIVNMNSGPLYRSGFSFNKLYDYLAVGRPVVFGTEAPNNPIAEAGAGITVPPNDAYAMAAAVEQIAALTPAERAAIGQHARAFVEEHHDIERLARRFADVLYLVAAGERQASLA